MKFSRAFVIVFFSFGILACSSDDAEIDNEQYLKSYELVSIEWKLSENDGQSIVEKKLPEFNFRNDSDTIMEVSIEPLEGINGSSKFTFNDSLTFLGLNHPEIEVPVPDELNLLSEDFRYIGGGVKVPFTNMESSFPFSWHFKDTFALNKRTKLTSNYTIYLRKNRASFLAIFSESTTGETLELEGTWTGLFFNNAEVESLAEEIE